MKIEILPKEGRKGVLTLFVDGEIWRDLHTSWAGHHPVFPACTTNEEWEAAFEQFEYKRVRGYVIWRLSAQAYHSQTLSKMLRERSVRSSTIDRVLKEFKASGYINDEAWVASYIESRQKRYGFNAILAQLRSKGLPAEVLQAIERPEKKEEHEKEGIVRLLRTRYRSKDLSEYKTKQKVFAALMRKGFAFENIQCVLNDFEV
ncbi:MAG: RecX family transcriptional regulator [Candidatus Protochlamydia sp.]|nr:RecX family transcriptional regulator [Candidatus Protochlamydia sp.]